MARQPISAREWLEDMLRFNSRDADRAQELIAVLDERQVDQDMLDEWGERIGDIDEAETAAKDYAKACEEMEGSELGAGFYSKGSLHDAVVEVLTYAAKLEKENWEIRELARAADLIRPKDETTPVAPLFRMFLPID